MIKIKRKVYEEIINTIGNSPIESGGILGLKDDVICAYYFDKNNYSNNEYIPNIKLLNTVIDEWYENDIEFVGVIHSHPNELSLLSNSDISYAKELLELNSYLDKIYFPIVTINKNNVNITFYLINDTVKLVEYVIIE